MSTEATLVAHVVLDSPLPQLDHPFDYKVPTRLQSTLRIGHKVVVPLRSGRRMCDAWVIALSETSSFAGNLAEVESLVGEVPILPSALYELARTVADRQAGSAVDVLRLAIPPRYVRAEKAFLNAHDGFPPEDDESKIVSAPTRGDAVLTRGQKVSWVFNGGVEQLSSGLWAPRWCVAYAKLAAEALSQGTSIVIAVPDFRDIEHMERALREVVDPTNVVRLDAGLPGAQRYTNYLRVLAPVPVIVLGNRSSVYAPAHNLGAIAIWDAADDSFAEPLAPYAHARDVALVRQSSTGCSLIFGSHVLSPEVARLVALGYLTEITDDAPEPDITITDAIDVPNEPDSNDGRAASRIPASTVVAARKAISDGPVLIQVARPGYSGSLRCKSCRERATCVHCSGPLRKASKESTPACRWCAKLAAGWQCSKCHSTAFSFGSPGTEKTAEDLGRAFPGVPVVLVDASREADYISHKPALVIATPGTEPLAEGGYEAVIILDGESTLSREGLDTDTDALRVWLNAASLAAPRAPIFVTGTGAALGKVLREGRQSEYVSNLLKEREALSLPPATRVALISGSRESVATVESALTGIPRRSVLGPVPAPDGSNRLILTFDFKDGAAVATALRALVIKTATTSKKPATSDGPHPRILRLNVRMDDTALRGLN